LSLYHEAGTALTSGAKPSGLTPDQIKSLRGMTLSGKMLPTATRIARWPFDVV
jgi:hypothetical protein